MGILSRRVFKEIVTGALLGTTMFTFVMFLNRLGRLFEQLVTNTTSLQDVGALFLLILPPALTFTIPIGILVGVLIATGRMSNDAEIIAMRAAGVSSRRLLIPVAWFALLGLVLSAYTSCILTPAATRETYRILNRMVAAQLTAEIRPQVFEEKFPNRILYVENVVTGPVVQWKKVFIADLRPPGDREGAGERGEGPKISLAAQAIAVPDLVNNRIQLSLLDGSSFEVGKASNEYISTSFPKGEQALDAPRRQEVKAKDFSEMDMEPLMEQSRSHVEAAIEFHRRLVLPVASLILAFLAVPLGVSSRKGGKSSAFVVAVVLGLLYFMGLISLIGLARQDAVPVGIGLWAPNIVFALLAAILLVRQEKPDDRDWGIEIRTILGRAWDWFRGKTPFARSEDVGTLRLPLLPQIVDTYVVSAFLYYFVVLLVSFVFMTHVFNFFELLGDIVKNRIPMPRVGTYHLFLTPMLVYDAAPMSVLVAVLITFGVLAKANEITAMKACGISVYRLAIPVLLCGGLLSASLFAFDYYVVPEANLVQDAIRNEIKGRPAQTFYRPDRKWIFGRGPWIYYYKHLDPDSHVMAGVNVYELDRSSFRLKRHIFAESARWEPKIKRWVFQNGWLWEFDGIQRKDYQEFSGKTATFQNLDEPPQYFLKEVIQDKQMNFHQLASYIGELQQSGVDTLKLQVQYEKKFSVPLFALIMALISTPFAFFSGNRGTMVPIGISLGIAIGYWVLTKLFEQMGNVGQLPPALAAWSPDFIFSLTGLYFLMRVRT
jgi:LPS export ABC transporter permease LptG/LPS export ABC transporter permease LptF